MTAASSAKIPVTVVGGFLGAGKTTYLNHLLRTGSARYAVLVNDFGAVNIDAGLIAQHDGTTMTLTNGCVCCSIGGGFLDTLGRILDDAIRSITSSSKRRASVIPGASPRSHWWSRACA